MSDWMTLNTSCFSFTQSTVLCLPEVLDQVSQWKNLLKIAECDYYGPNVYPVITQQCQNLVSPYHDNNGLSWTVSTPVKGIVESVERHGVLQTLICAHVVRPKRCPTSSNPALLRSWTVVCPSFTLLLLLPGWPTMGLNRIRKKN